MSLIDKQLTGQTPRAGTMSHGITAGGVARPLLVNDDGTVNVTGGGGGTEYTEGATDASITGGAIMWEDTGDTLRAVSASKPLPVNGSGVTQPVSASSLPLPTGASTSAKQDTIIGHVDGIETLIGTTNTTLGTIDTDTGGIATSTASIDTKTPALGQALAAGSVPVVLTVAQISALTPPAAITGFATSAKQDTLLTELQLKADLTETQPVSLASVPSHAVTNAGTFAVQATEADGANVTLGSKTDAKSTATDATSITAMQVLKQISASVQAPPSQVVTATDLDIRNLVNTDVVTAELSATDNAVLDAIAASVAAIDTDTSTIITHTSNSATALQIMDDWDNGASDGASISGDVAHDSADAGEPVKIGGKAVSAEITPVTANDRVNASFDLVGKQIVLPYANPENFVSGAITSAMTGTTSTSLIAAPASGLRNYITTIIVSNAHATVGTDIVIQDGSGGTTLLTIPAAAVYGGAVITLPTPLRQPTTATAIYCANVTTGASTKVSAVGYKGA